MYSRGKKKSAPTIIEGKQARVSQLLLSWLLMVPLVYLDVGSLTSFQTSGSGGYGGMEQDQQFFQNNSASIAARLVTLLVWAVCFYGIVTYLPRVLKTCWEMKTISSLALLSIVSVLWSQDPGLTFLKSILLISGLLFSYYLVERFTPDEQMQLFLFLGSVVLVLSVLVSVALPKYGVDMTGAWRGIFNHKNRLSRGALLLLPPALILPARGFQRITRGLYILIALACIGMSQSRTGWVVTGAYFGFFFTLRLFSRFKKKDMVSILLIFAGFFGYILWLVIDNFATLTRLLGKDPTMSGRTQIWSAILDSGLKQPLLGFGYGAFWRGQNGESLNIFLQTGFALWQGHNAFLDIWLDLGLVGLGLFLLTLIKAFRDGFYCLKPGRPRSVDWHLSTVFIIVALSMTQGQLLIHNSIIILLYFIACIGLHRARKEMMTRPPGRSQVAPARNA
ncbi:MAG: O-antigen ligase family protein [Alloacidobacterium sp.]